MKYFRIIICFLLIGVVFYSFSFGYKKIDEDYIIKQSDSYKGIISLWQIDTFEGGKGSRKQFLNSIAREYEKQNKGVLISATDMTIEGARMKIENKEYPDMISFGLGMEVLDAKKIITDLYCKGGIVNGNIYGVAWCKGGYFLIKNNKAGGKKDFKNKLLIGVNEGINTEIAYSFLEQKFQKTVCLNKEDAFQGFLVGDSEYYLGTQRDIERLSYRDFDYSATLIEKYNDLFQYISIISDDEIKYGYALDFINCLTKVDNQKKLKSISMFSPYYNIEYDNQTFNDSQYFGDYQTVSCFTSLIELKDIKLLKKDFINGNESALTKLKKCFI